LFEIIVQGQCTEFSETALKWLFLRERDDYLSFLFRIDRNYNIVVLNAKFNDKLK